MTRLKSISLHLQKQIEARVNSSPAIRRAFSRIRKSDAGKYLINHAHKSKKHIEVLFKDFPQDFKSVKPYLNSQKKNLKAWKEDLVSQLNGHPSSMKSKVKKTNGRKKAKTNQEVLS